MCLSDLFKNGLKLMINDDKHFNSYNVKHYLKLNPQVYKSTSLCATPKSILGSFGVAPTILFLFCFFPICRHIDHLLSIFHTRILSLCLPQQSTCNEKHTFQRTWLDKQSDIQG